MNKVSHRLLPAVACLVTIPFTSLTNLMTQAQEEGPTRKIWDTAYNDQANKPAAARRLAARRRYRVVTPHVSPADISADTVLGVTIWRLRPSKPADAGERLLSHESGSAVEWVPERVSSDTKFAEGDRLRLSFEAARAGYLYVIDREQYSDGTMGEPYLIFPTTRTRGGNNAVSVGAVVEIPAQDDNPPYFTLRRSQPSSTGENLTVLVTPAPIEDLRIDDRSQKLSPEKAALWEKSWGGQAGRLEMAGGEGLPWTRAEKDAGADRTRSLSDSEPAPQTLYYRPGAKSNDPLLIKVQLHYRSGRPAVKRRPRA